MGAKPCEKERGRAKEREKEKWRGSFSIYAILLSSFLGIKVPPRVQELNIELKWEYEIPCLNAQFQTGHVLRLNMEALVRKDKNLNDNKFSKKR